MTNPLPPDVLLGRPIASYQGRFSLKTAYVGLLAAVGIPSSVGQRSWTGAVVCLLLSVGAALWTYHRRFRMLELYEGGFVLRTTRQIRIVRSYDVTSVELDVVDDVCDGVIGTRDGAVSITDFLKGNELRVVLHQILGRR